MLPLRRGAFLLRPRWIAARSICSTLAAESPPPPPLGTHPSALDPARTSASSAYSSSSSSSASPSFSPSNSSPDVSASAKLFADALEEEHLEEQNALSRDQLVHTQGPIWTGEESQQDAVLRMLTDAHKPLRTGESLGHDSADKRIHAWMKDFNPELPSSSYPPVRPSVVAAALDAIEAAAQPTENNPHRTHIPPHLHRPWHATYTGDTQVFSDPKVRYGSFEDRPQNQDFSNLFELKVPVDADGATKAKIRDAKKSYRLQGRIDKARDDAIDYHLGIRDGDVTQVGSSEDNGHEDGTFQGNRQIRGNSVLGAAKGGASGMRAWTSLVEDRIQRAQESGYFEHVKGRGAPIIEDPESKNPFVEQGELFMNRIIKRQGALPPWIEMQQNLDNNIRSFRTLLLDSYTRHLVRQVLSSNSLHALPPLHSIPGQDEAWEQREHKFHEENIRQINSLTRKMNTLAPFQVRRGTLSLEGELNKVRGDTLRDKVFHEVQHRVAEIKDIEANGPYHRRNLLASFENNALSRLGSRMGGGGSGGAFSIDPGSGPGHSAAKDAGGGIGLLIFAGVGIGALVCFKRYLTNNKPPDTNHLIPVHGNQGDPSERFIASSPAETPKSLLELLRIYIWEPIATVFRFLHLAFLFAPVILTCPMLFVGAPPRRRPGKPVDRTEENWGAVWWYGFLVSQMERAGASFIKLGQWAASRADLFPASLCDRMSKLHSSNDPHPMRHTRRVIERAFAMDFDDIFEEFDETPIGCGAIAQVYKAKLRPEIAAGSKEEAERLTRELQETLDDDRRIVTTVAIKVLHPRVRQTVRRDIAIMSIFANIVNAFPGMEWISLPEEVLVFGDMMNQQLDLRVETANLEKFIENFKHRPPIVTFPVPIRLSPNGSQKAQRDVMIEQFEDALPLKYFLENGGGPFDRKIANIGLDAFLEMLLLDNWTHGDLHPGNIMVRFVRPHTYHIIGPFLKRMWGQEPPPPPPNIPTESVSETEMVHELRAIAHDKDAWLERLDQIFAQGYAAQLVFIDAGLVTSLDAKNRRNFLDLFQAVAEFDGYKAGHLMIERCRHPELAIDEETFALKMQHLVLSVKSKTFSLAKIKISDILTDVLKAVRQHHVKLEGDFVNTVISILLLEGIGRQLDPDMDLFKSALPILRQLGRQLGTREAISQVPAGNLWAMIKLWVWAEVREVAGEGRQLDDWIKLFPNI